MTFNVSCSPGGEAAAGSVQVAEHQPGLVLFLDPVNMVLRVPPVPDGERVLAGFCRELAREAVKFADAIDPRPGVAESSPRHLLREDGDGRHG